MLAVVFGDRHREVEHGIARDRSTVAAIGDHNDTNRLGKSPPQRIQLVVNEHPVEQNPRFVPLVFGIVAVEVRHLRAVPGVADEEDIARAQCLGGSSDFGGDPVSRRLRREDDGTLEAASLGQRLQVVGIELAPDKRERPSVVTRIDLVDADMNRPADSRAHGTTP